MKKKISIITPCYNEEGNIKNAYNAVKEIFVNYKNYEYEHVFIDNKSTDNTREILKELAKEDEQVKLIFNARNYGQWASPFHALKNSNADATILLVADLQDPPELIHDFIKAWEEGYKTIIGIKTNTEGSKISYFLRKSFYKLINNLSDVMQIIDETNSIKNVKDKSLVHLSEIQSHLKKFQESPYKKIVMDLAEFSVHRIS